MSHTPGPWQAIVGPKEEQPQTLYWGLVAIVSRSPDPDGYVSVVTDGTHAVSPESYADDARLMAAAPDLLAAAKAAVTHIRHADDCDADLHHERFWDCSCGAGRASLALQAAIAKAEGREP